MSYSFFVKLALSYTLDYELLRHSSDTPLSLLNKMTKKCLSFLISFFFIKLVLVFDANFLRFVCSRFLFIYFIGLVFFWYLPFNVYLHIVLYILCLFSTCFISSRRYFDFRFLFFSYAVNFFASCNFQHSYPLLHVLNVHTILIRLSFEERRLINIPMKISQQQ